VSRIQVGFDNVNALLLLLVLLPAFWLLGRKSLSGLGTVRWLLAIGLRSAVVVLIVCALAEMQLLQISEKVTVIYVLDQSESVPLNQRQAMLDYTMREVAEHRGEQRGDRAGVIVFGRTASMEVPPFDEDILVLDGIDSYVDLRTDATNLAAALKLAKASFPEDSAKRVVIVTDGNENLGSARAVLASLAEDGIGIDVAPVRLESRAEVAVERIAIPPEIRRGQPVEVRVVLDNFATRSLSGQLRISRRIGPQQEVLSEPEVELKPGKNVYTFTHEIEQSAVYHYQADFVPRDPADDGLTQNNRATSFTQVRGKGRVLLIENWQTPGEFDHLVDRLRQNQIDVTVQATNQLFSSLAELQAYDAVVLANVPRSSGDDAQAVHSLSDQQIEMLVRNTEQMGCGLIMLGGANSFGVGGWSNTALEKAMPVDFQIKNAQMRAVGALALMMHASELGEGNYWQKEVATQAIQALGPMDYCGLIHWDGGSNRWLWRDESGRGIIQVGERRTMMLRRVGKMTPQDMPEFDPGMQLTLAELNPLPAGVKLMIVISDGDPSPPSMTTVAAFQRAGIQVSTVAVGAHGPAGHKTLQDLAAATGGRYYVASDPRALPKIYVSEVRRVARPLIHEPINPVQPQVVYRHDILEGIDGPLPPITGFVLTTVKENPLVEVLAVSPDPPDPRSATVLAAWTYGLGRTAVLTTDAGRRWASSWTQWEDYDKLFTQLVRWALRPMDDTGNFSVATDVREGKVRTVVTALDRGNEFLNFLNISGSGVDPELESLDLRFAQVAPGRYLAEFEATKEGSYFLTIKPGPGYAPLLTGVIVPYSAEFRDRETNAGLLQTLASAVPAGGQSGVVMPGEVRTGNLDSWLTVDTFRGGLAPAISSADVWPAVLLLSACLFFADVLVRRVTIEWHRLAAWCGRLLARFRRPSAPVDNEERLDRLRSRKAEIAEELDERRATARFMPELPADKQAISEVAGGEASPASAPKRTSARPETSSAPNAPDEPTYTERLLQAKRRAWQDDDQPPGTTNSAHTNSENPSGE